MLTLEVVGAEFLMGHHLAQLKKANYKFGLIKTDPVLNPAQLQTVRTLRYPWEISKA
jgi:hypothetical protein